MLLIAGPQYHLGRNIGLASVSKPDTHLMLYAHRHGFSDAQVSDGWRVRLCMGFFFFLVLVLVFLSRWVGLLSGIFRKFETEPLPVCVGWRQVMVRRLAENVSSDAAGMSPGM